MPSGSSNLVELTIDTLRTGPYRSNTAHTFWRHTRPRKLEMSEDLNPLPEFKASHGSTLAMPVAAGPMSSPSTRMCIESSAPRRMPTRLPT